MRIPEAPRRRVRLGFLINPIAGMGGRVPEARARKAMALASKRTVKQTALLFIISQPTPASDRSQVLWRRGMQRGGVAPRGLAWRQGHRPVREPDFDKLFSLVFFALRQLA